MRRLCKLLRGSLSLAVWLGLGVLLGGLRLAARSHELELRELRGQVGSQAQQLEELRQAVVAETAARLELATRLDAQIDAHNGWADVWEQQTEAIRDTADYVRELNLRVEDLEDAAPEFRDVQQPDVWFVRRPGR